MQCCSGELGHTTTVKALLRDPGLLSFFEEASDGLRNSPEGAKSEGVVVRTEAM